MYTDMVQLPILLWMEGLKVLSSIPADILTHQVLLQEKMHYRAETPVLIHATSFDLTDFNPRVVFFTDALSGMETFSSSELPHLDRVI